MDSSAASVIPTVVAIFVAEFHPTQGPRVACQVPEGFVRSTHSANASLSALAAFNAAASASVTANASVTASSSGFAPVLRTTLASGGLDSPSGRSTPPIPARPQSPPFVDDTSIFEELSSPLPESAVQSEPSASALPLVLQRFPSITSNVGSMTNTNNDDVEGSQLLHLDFDSVTEYVIPKADMCNKLVAVSAKRWKVVGHPVMIEDPKYPRNALIFNCCFVFERNADTSCYDNIVRRIARVFRFVETETEFISKPKPEVSVQNILEELIEDLNKYHECRIPIGGICGWLRGQVHIHRLTQFHPKPTFFLDEINALNLKVFPKYPEPAEIHDYDVPILLVDIVSRENPSWDMMVRHLLPFINGVDHVKKIVAKADVDLNLAKIAIQHLIHYRCARVIDIFQFSNVYAVQRPVKKLLNDQDLRRHCVEFVSFPDETGAKISLSQAFMLYSAFRDGTQVLQWMTDNEVSSVPIEIRHFIVFGVIKGFLKRIHKYPRLRVNISPASSLPGGMGESSRGQSLIGIGVARQGPPSPILPDGLEGLRELLDGTHHFDDICTRLEMPVSRLETMLELFGDGKVEIEWK